MKKTKKILSALTALAITASAFAGMAVPASADDNGIVYLAPEGETNVGGQIKITYDAADKALLIIAKYDDNKVLESVSSEEITFDNGVYEGEQTLSKGDKIMLWDSFNGMNALLPVKVVEDGDEPAEPTPTTDVTEPTPTTEVTEPTPTTEATEPTPTPTEEPAATEEPIVGTVYIDEPFDYDDGEIIKSLGYDNSAAEKPAPDPVTKGSIVYAAGVRANATAINCNAKIANKELVISSDGYATSSRGISFTFAESAAVPTTADIEDTESLELRVDVKTDQNFTVLGYGDITTTDLTTTADYVRLRIILDKTNNKQYQIVTDLKGNLLTSKIADLTATTFTGMTFYAGAGTQNIDNLIIAKHDTNTGIVDVTVTDSGESDAALAGATVAVSKAAFTTGSDGKVAIAMPDGEHTITASKSGYEHTSGASDDDSATVTVAGDSKTAALSLQIKTYDKIPETINFSGGQTFVAAPKTADTTDTAAFTVTVLDQFGIEMKPEEYTLTWNIYPTGTDTANEYVSINAGVVSVAKGFKAESKSGVDTYDVTATVVANNAGLRGMTNNTALYVGNMDIIYYEPVAWETSDRTGNKKFTSETNIDGVVTAALNTTISATTSSRAGVWRGLSLDTDAGKLCGIIYQKSDGNVYAWTGYSGTSGWNQYDDGGEGKYANYTKLIEGYELGTNINVSFTIDPSTKSITATCGDTSVPLTYTIEATKITGATIGRYDDMAMPFKLDDVTIQEPDNNYLSISGTTEIAKVSGKTIESDYVLGMSVIVPDEIFTWAVEKPEGAADGKVTISDGKLSIADEATPGVYTVKAVSASNADKKAEIKVTVADFQTFTLDKAEVSGPHAYQLGKDTTGTYKIEKLVDSLGVDVAVSIPAPAWASSNTDVATIDAATGVLTVVGAGDTNITATITNGTAISTLTIPVTVGTYYVTSNTVGSTVDISSLISSDKITGYQVTVADADGKQLAKEVVQKDGTTVAVPTYTGTAASVEVAPVFEYAVGAPGSLGNLGAGYDIAIPADTYNFNVKDTGGRCDVYVNKQMIVNNILQGSSAINNLDVNDIIVSEGVAKITSADYASGANESGVNLAIKVVKSPSNVTRKQKIYVLGDSLVCIYYNGGNATNNYQTGWGQVLQNYVKDDVEVVDLGNSGVTAEGLAGTAITQVQYSAQKGDIVLIESGYNDANYSTTEKMRAALASMKEKAEAKDATVIFVSPNASHHDYKGNVVWTTTMESYVTEAEAKYIDLSQKSYDFLFSRYGTDFASGSAVNDLSKIYNVSDRLHSTYYGAHAWASIVASGLIENGFGDIVNTEYKYEFTDGLGKTVICQAKAAE